jgi:hypothetical protein
MKKLLGYPVVETSKFDDRTWAKVIAFRDNKTGRIKIKWYSLPDTTLVISGELMRSVPGLMKKFPRGWGLHCIRYSRVQDLYFYRRYRF